MWKKKKKVLKQQFKNTEMMSLKNKDATIKRRGTLKVGVCEHKKKNKD